MIIRIFLLLLFLTASNISFAQLSMDDFLRSAENDPEVKTVREQIRYMKEKPYRLSPLQRLEFRTQNRELDRQQQEYALRFSPANPWEIRNNNLYFKAYESSLALENELLLKEALLARYYAVINFLYHQELKKLVAENHQLITDQLSILESQSGSSYFDADEYLDLQIDHLDKSVELEEVGLELLNAINEIDRLNAKPDGTDVQWDIEQIISIYRIKNVVDSLATTSLTSIMVEYQRQKINLANSEYKLEKANINAGFIQTEFDNRRISQDRTPFNISFGITIPITNPNKGDMTKRRLESIEAQNELDEATNENRSASLIAEEKITRLVERYKNLTGKMDALQNSSLAGTLSTLKGGDPRFILRFHENQVKLKVMLAKLRRDLLTAYVDYLSFSDKLQQQPLLNYFSAALREIK
jgi:hypothetical protein